jgi:GNAT superfamily N-acetyltransferase
LTTNMTDSKPGTNGEASISIRQAALDDLDTLVRLRLAMLDELYPPDPDTNVQKLAAANRRYFAQKLPNDEYVGWIAEADEQIAGAAGLILFERPPMAWNLSGIEAYVLNVYTVPAWRGHGIASQLIETVIAYARTTPIRRLWLHASPDGARIYQRAGFIDRIEMELRW